MPQKKSVPLVCPNCSKQFLVRPIEVKRGARCCSRSCASKIGIASTNLRYGKGEDNPAWKGGTRSTKGYLYVKAPRHPRAMKSGYVKWADLVLEEKLGRPLQPDEIAHHKDEDKTNDSPENLEPISNTDHTRLHHPRVVTAQRRQPEHPANRRYLWPDDQTLLQLHTRFSLREIAAKIGCSHKAVDIRLKKIRSK